MAEILILGAGGHAKVVAEILLSIGESIIGFLSDDPTTWGMILMGLPVLGDIESYSLFSPGGLIIAIGDNMIRYDVVKRIGEAGCGLWVNAIHPSAIISPSVSLGKGVVVTGGAVINADSVLGNHVIVNTGATVGHDCRVDDFAHVAPGAHLGGGVRIGQGAFVCTGASVIPQVEVGRWSTIGAGAAVVKDIPEGVVAKGVPARWVDTHDPVLLPPPPENRLHSGANLTISHT